jgi:hypothetical protein
MEDQGASVQTSEEFWLSWHVHLRNLLRWAQKSAKLTAIPKGHDEIAWVRWLSGFSPQNSEENGGNCLSFLLQCWIIFECLNTDKKNETEI